MKKNYSKILIEYLTYYVLHDWNSYEKCSFQKYFIK